MIYGFGSFGYEGSLVKVETDIKNGIPAIEFVGLADSCVTHTRERIRTAIEQSGFEIPQKRILISLIPSDTKKDEVGFALPVALSLLVESKNNDVLVMGVLEINGNIKPNTKSTFAACQNAVNKGIKYAIISKGSYVPAGIKVYEVDNLKEAADAITNLNIGDDSLFKEKDVSKNFSTDDNILFNDVTSDLKQDFDKTENNNLKFAMAVAIAGRHHTVVSCNSGTRYNTLTIIETGLPMLLPRLSADESDVVSRIYSLAGLYRRDLYERPVRMPHNSCTIEGMCGGGVNLSPGETALTHNGVLFLDDASEFRTSVLQMLRVPLSAEKICLSRAGRVTTYPSKFQLFMVASPCPCGNFGSKEKLCLCSLGSVNRYRTKLTFPLNDRIAVKLNTSSDDNSAKKFTLEELRNFISTAWKRQLHRQGKLNQDLSLDEAFDLKISSKAREVFEKATDYFSDGRKAEILKLAQTLNDVSDGSEELQEEHIAEAVKLNEDNLAAV